MKFAGKKAIITGAGNGIGKATAMALAKEGAAVAVFDIDKDKLEKVSGSIRAAQGEVLSFAVDVMNKAAVKAAMAEIMAAFKHIDILVNNAGAGWHKQLPFKDTPEEDWECHQKVDRRMTHPGSVRKQAGTRLVHANKSTM